MMPTDTKAESAKPYSLIAPIYDSMMRHVSYPEWADYYETIFRRSGNNVFDVHDIACGTGSLLIELFQKGFNLSGSDLSPEMVQIARKKCARLGLDIPWTVEAMDAPRPAEYYDAVICTYDSINYLTAESEWVSCLTAVYKALRPKGLFVFDISTESNSRQNFDQVMEIDRLNRFKRISLYDERGRIQVNRIEMTLHGRMFAEEHRQRIYGLDEVKSMIGKSPFHVEGMYDHFTFNEGTEESERIHFVLRK